MGYFGQVMPKGLQTLKMKDELKRAGISPDKVDLDALIDSCLSFGENQANIMQRYKGKDASRSSRKSKQSKFGVGNVDFKYDHQFEESRPQRSRSLDESRENKRTYSERQISNKPHLLDQWYKRPGRIDIIGIDTPIGRKRKR